MARPSRKNIYERINDKIMEIQKTEDILNKLNKELQELYSQKDKEEMEKLLAQVKESGLSIDKALELLQSKKK